MKVAIGGLAGLGALLVVSGAFAQVPSNAVVVAACGTPGTTYTAGQAQPLTMDVTGKLCDGASAAGQPGYKATPVGTDVMITPTTATAPTIPGTATFCTFSAWGQTSTYQADGTAPTTTTGNQLFPGGVLTGYGQTYLTALKFIQTATGGTIWQSCFK